MEPALLLAGKYVGKNLNTMAPKRARSKVVMMLQKTVVLEKTQPSSSLRREAIPDENPKKTRGIRTNPPTCTSTAVMVYISC